MKKILIIGLIAVMLLATAVIADEEECDQDCLEEQRYQERMNEIAHEAKLKAQKMITVGGGGFYLQKDKTLFNLTSKYNGYGFGVVFGKFINSGLKLNSYQTNLRSITINPEKNSLTNLNAFHFKRIPTKTFKNYNSIESYEFLTNIQKIKNYKIEFRVEKGVKPYLIVEGKDGTTLYEPNKISKQGYTQEYYSAFIDDVKILTIAEKKK